MKHILCGLGVLLGLSAPAWSLSCVPTPAYTITHTDNVYPDSVLWLRSDDMPSQAPITVGDVDVLQEGKALPKLQTLPTRIGAYTGFKPTQALQSGLGYQVLLRDASRDRDYMREVANRFTVAAAKPLPALAWQLRPRLKQVGHHHSAWGDGGNIMWTLQTNVPRQDYLVVLKLAAQADMQQAQTFVLKPADLNGDTVIGVSFGPCQYGPEAYVFAKSSTVWATFDLLSHDGHITAWTDPPERFKLKLK